MQVEQPQRAAESSSVSDDGPPAEAAPASETAPGLFGLAWPSPLMPYQVTGVQRLLDEPGVLLADDMGLGKTVQAIAAIRVLIARSRARAFLIVTPASLTIQWRRELRKWAPELSAIVVKGVTSERHWQWRTEVNVVIVSYETLRADLGSPASPPRIREWDCVVLDEAQRIKNREIDVSQRVKTLRRRRSWALTGTPIENQVDDLVSILEFVEPKPQREPDWDLFSAHPRLQLRRRKADVLTDLPPKLIIDIPLEMSGPQRATYDRVQATGLLKLRALGPEIRVQHVLEMILRLKQVCNFDPVTGASVKLDDVGARMTDLAAEGHRALVFSQFTQAPFGVAAIVDRLAQFNPLSFTGALSESERDVVIERFRTRPSHQALVLSLKAGGVGLNLQDASYVFHVDRWWNPAVERQAEDRTHRMGQQYPVTCYRYTIVNTIEEHIDSLLRDKQQLFDAVVDDVWVDLSTRFSRAEIMSLVGL